MYIYLGLSIPEFKLYILKDFGCRSVIYLLQFNISGVVINISVSFCIFYPVIIFI